MKSIDFVLGQPWAMLPEMVETLISIADRVNEAPEAVAARLGKPLDNARTVQDRDGVAVIPVRGPISRYSNMFTEISGATSVDVLARDFQTALASPDIKGIILEIDSPGGQAAGIGELASMIRAGARTKPVVSYVSNLGASAALWLASAGARVVLAPSGIMGSMGVVWPVAVDRKDDKGPRTIEFVSSQSPNKRPDPETKAGAAELQRIVDQMAQVFVESVASYRGMKPVDCIAKFGRGGLLVGQAAVDAGMADRLGSLESCIEDMQKDSNGPKSIIHMNADSMKGIQAQDDTAVSAEAATDTIPAETERNPVPETSPDIAAQIAAATAQIRSETAKEIRLARLDAAQGRAQAFVALHSDKLAPAEHEGLIAGYIAAVMLDAEAPIEGFSFTRSFAASIEGRKPHGLTTETVTGDASEIAEHLSATGTKILPNAAASPDELAAKESDARIAAMLDATEFGRLCAADQK